MKNILEKINQSAFKFLEPLTPEETYARIVKEAIDLVGAENGSILLEVDGTLERVYSSNPLLYKLRVRPRGYTYTAFRTRKPISVDSNNIATIHPKLKDIKVKSLILIPLSYKNKSIGVLTVHTRKKERFTEDELSTLKLFGSMATLVIRKTQLYIETQKTLEVRNMFISMAAHELRTPLTTIHGYIQLLQKSFQASNTREKEWVDEVAKQTRRFIQIVDKLLEVNRVQAGKQQYVLRKWSMEEIILRAIDRLHFSHPNSKVHFKNLLKESQDIVIGDFDKLLQVVVNILENSAKFSPPQSAITIVASFKSAIILRIYDQGRGIPQKDIPKIFEGFYKGSENFQEGMGVGLLLAKHYIRQHHGTLTITSQLNKGTTVEIKLPKGNI